MIRAAKAKGLDESGVDSIIQRRGTKEFEDFERRNGFKLLVNEAAGFLMVQHFGPDPVIEPPGFKLCVSWQYIHG